VEDQTYVLRSLVVSRAFLVKQLISSKNHLHSLAMAHYPNYRSFFTIIDSGSSLAFFDRFPSPPELEGVTFEELSAFLAEHSTPRWGRDKARKIIDGLEDTAVPFQKIRDISVQATVRQIRFYQDEIQRIEATLGEVLAWFDTTLLSMKCISTVCAAQMLSCIGDIKKIPTPAKLARYAGIAPVTYASGQKDLRFSNQRGNRELNSVIHQLAVRLVSAGNKKDAALNIHFYEYFQRKQAEGKTKKQALKCVQRRLGNIIWNMLTYGTEYENPAAFGKPKGGEKSG